MCEIGTDDFAPALFLAVPFGIVADKFGRKLVLIPVMCSFPIKGAIVQIVCKFSYHTISCLVHRTYYG